MRDGTRCQQARNIWSLESDPNPGGVQLGNPSSVLHLDASRESRMNIRLVSKIVFVMALFSATLLLAQDSASVTGTVRDSSEQSSPTPSKSPSPPPTAASIARPPPTATANIPWQRLPPGSYNIDRDRPRDSRNIQAKGVVLRVGQKARVDVPLQVGERPPKSPSRAKR